jgi:hypothetical protein
MRENGTYALTTFVQSGLSVASLWAVTSARRPKRLTVDPYQGQLRVQSSLIGTSSFRDGCVRGEDGSHGGFVALEVDEPKRVVKGEHTRCQSENDRRVSAHDGVEIAAIVRVHLDARARRPHLEKLVVDRDPHRR